MSHHCHATGCTAVVAPVLWGCRRHWYMVPKSIRAAIWRAYRPGQCDDRHPSRDYCLAAKAAVEAVAALEGRVPDTRVYDLFLGPGT